MIRTKGTVPSAVPLVLLNAFPVDKEQWDPLIEALGDASVPQLGDIITFDVPGIGDMPIPEEEPSLDLIADAAVVAMREATGATAAVWVGCSMGGYIAMAVADRHGDAVAGLGLIGTKATADTAQARQKRLDTAASVDGKPGMADPRAAAEGLVGTRGPAREAIVEAVAANIARHAGSSIAWGQRAMAARPDRLGVLEDIGRRGSGVPAAVLRGEFDSVVTPADAEAMAVAVGVQVEEVPGVGHLAALEAPEAVTAAVQRLVAAASIRSDAVGD